MIPPSSRLALFTIGVVPYALGAVEPRQAVWSSETFGPDGPWNAVEVSLGTQSKIALFPGRMWNTFVTTTDYCTINSSVAHCVSGAYNKGEAVEESRARPAQDIAFKQPTQELYAGLEAGGDSSLYLESINMLFKDGIIQNHSLALIDSAQQMFAYPGGTWYPIFTGCLSVGAPERFQVFAGDGASMPTLNASMIPWALKDQNMTTSSSFGLHYGSATSAAKMTGSLLYGGYDRNRVVGKTLSIDGDLFKPVTLQDISIRVIQGSSPFNSATAISGLLAQGNSSISSAGLPVILDPCNPYLTLPKSTCDSIAAHLPVSYNASLGLYLWNTSSPRYAPVVTSASTLSFTLMGASNTESLTIHMPFRHLSLNLTAPFTATFEPIPYLPCFTGGIGAYALGRAFFQDAFVGANWEKRKVWLAQAPGPNIPAGVNAVSIQPDQDAIVAGGNDWERSWDGFWKALSAEEADGTEPVDTTSIDTGTGTGTNGSGGDGTAPGTDERGSQGLSTAAMAGIAVGAAVGGMAVVAAGVLFWCRRRKAREPRQSFAPPTKPVAALSPAHGDNYDGAKWEPWVGGLYEAPDSRNRVHEMPGDQPIGAVGLGLAQ